MIVAHAIFAAGCFWGVQDIFENIPGVLYTQVGYTGGTVASPNYADVSSGKTGHAEAIEVSYDPQVVSYDELLDVFFGMHDPTTKDRQGPDIGNQYRSAVFYMNEQQKEAAVNKIIELKKLNKYNKPIVTEVVAAKTFYPAEDYHQHYLQKSGETSCHFNP